MKNSEDRLFNKTISHNSLHITKNVHREKLFKKLETIKIIEGQQADFSYDQIFH